jgi:hypothetical protein
MPIKELQTAVQNLDHNVRVVKAIMSQLNKTKINQTKINQMKELHTGLNSMFKQLNTALTQKRKPMKSNANHQAYINTRAKNKETEINRESKQGIGALRLVLRNKETLGKEISKILYPR